MEKDDSFWLNICYLLFGLLVGYVMWHAIITVGIQTGWGERYDEWYAPMGYAVATLSGIGAAVFLRSSPDRNDYFLSAIGELRKVSWPSMEDTRRMTIIVCVVVAIFAAIMTVFDMGWSFALKKIISTFS